MSVVIETSIGDLVIDLYTDERPNCCKNFLKLCKVKYYHHSPFYSVQKNFVAQSGDPTGTGRDGESIFSMVYGEQAKYFEMEKFPKIKHRKLGAISMINNGQDMHGSQFLVTLAENLDYLDGQHTVFGEVAKGFDVLDKLNEWICDKEYRPYQDIRIMHTVILEDPFEDFPSLDEMNRCASPEPTEERLASDRIRIDEDVDELDGLTPEELEEYTKNREARTRTKLLEIIGDIPDADIKPPENVLFVCKLNQVTNDDDLELIFSRFGKINSCEVIRDKKTGDSLCYAFIEFDREEDCETAYFKMDNVLIDDRRIHVDFSQSVSKVNWKGKGTGTGYFNEKPDFNKQNFKRDDEPEEKRSKFQIVSKSRKGEGYDLVFDETEKKSKYESISNQKYSKSSRYESSDRYQHRTEHRSSHRDDRHKKDKYQERSSERDRTSGMYRADKSSDRRPKESSHRSKERENTKESKYVKDDRHRRHRERSEERYKSRR